MGLKGVFRQRQHLRGIEGLHDVVKSTILHRLDRSLGGAEGGHKDDQLLGVGRTDVLQGFQTAHASHAHIEKNQIRHRTLLHGRDSGFTAASLHHLVFF